MEASKAELDPSEGADGQNSDQTTEPDLGRIMVGGASAGSPEWYEQEREAHVVDRGE